MAHSGEICRTLPARPFKTGLTLHTPLDCTDITCELLSCSQPDLALAMGALRTDEWVRSWIVTQLVTQARIPDACALPPGSVSPRGWWADSYRSSKFVSGSLLWTISFQKGVSDAVEFSRLYAQTALAPLRKWGIVDKVDVVSRYAGQGSLTLSISVSGPSLRKDVSVLVSGTTLPDMGWIWAQQ